MLSITSSSAEDSSQEDERRNRFEDQKFEDFERRKFQIQPCCPTLLNYFSSLWLSCAWLLDQNSRSLRLNHMKWRTMKWTGNHALKSQRLFLQNLCRHVHSTAEKSALLNIHLPGEVHPYQISSTSVTKPCTTAVKMPATLIKNVFSPNQNGHAMRTHWITYANAEVYRSPSFHSSKPKDRKKQ